MIKNELLQPELLPLVVLKACFGTKEWSQKSGICGKCKLKNGCEKAMNNSKNL